jgi:hypothetical protein
MSKSIKATHEGRLTIGELEIPCAVLADGTRLLTQGGFLIALGRSRTPKAGTGGSVAKIPFFISASNLKPFIDNDLLVSTTPISFITAKGIRAWGYKAELLPKVCEVYLKARQHKAILTSQKPIVDHCEILVRGLAHVGIISLVDEATGYQEARDKTALQEFLSKFIKEQRGIYVRTYPDEFFEAIFKMKHLTWKLANKGRKPQFIGHYINNYVYSRIAPNVLTELRRVNPKDETGKRKAKHTQHIDIDYGHPKLREHVGILIAFAKAAGYNWTNWERMVNRALPRFEGNGSQIQEIPFEEVEGTNSIKII